MATRSLTINQDYQRAPVSKASLARPAQIFPDPQPQQTETNSKSTLKSIATVLSQALSTKDQQTVRQLLVTASDQVISNTVADLQPSRLAALFEAVEVILLEETTQMANVNAVSRWLSALLKKNIGQIINSQQLQIVCSRIQKILQKRISALPTFYSLHSRLPNSPSHPQSSQPVYTPKFHYIEQEHELEHKDEQDRDQERKEMNDSDISELGAEDLENLDQMLMEDDMDLDI